MWAKNSAEAGVPTWRYIYNGSFPNIEFLPNVTLGAYHTSEIWQVFTSYEAGTETAQQATLSNSMRGAWARFAKNPVSTGSNPIPCDLLVKRTYANSLSGWWARMESRWGRQRLRGKC
jgi:carboxylesterase type B